MKILIILVLGYVLYQMYMSDKEEKKSTPAQVAQVAQVSQPSQNTEPFADAYPFATSSLDPSSIVAQTVQVPEASQSSMTISAANIPPSQAVQKVESPVANDKLTVSDLLPADKNSLWAEVTPTTGSLEGVNLTEAGYHVGVNTVGQTLKNANYQIRSDPPVPKFNVGPFNNSTIEYDDNRRPLEIA